MLEKRFRLHKKHEYQQVFAQGSRFVSRLVVVYIFKDKNASRSQVGFIASKKVGNAVQRNKAKRLMREIVRQKMPLFSQPCQMVCIARNAMKSASYDDVKNSLCTLWRKGGIVC